MRAAVTSTELAGLNKQERIALLRRRIAGMPGHPGAANSPVLPAPPPLAGLLPGGGFTEGSVATYTGPGSLLVGTLAAATSAGHVAIVGKPELGLLAAVEMGAKLERIAIIADPGHDRLEIAAILLDGLSFVVLELAGTRVNPARARVLAARARNSGAVLLVTGGQWTYPELRIRAHSAGFSGLERGGGRLRAISLDVMVEGKGFQSRSARLRLDDRGQWEIESSLTQGLRAVS